MSRSLLTSLLLVTMLAGTAHGAGDDNKLQGTEKLASLNENTRGAIDKAQRKLEYAAKSFWEFRNAPDDTAKKAYGKFKNDAEEFRKQAIDAREKIWSTDRDATAYFAEWEHEDALMTDPRRRERSEKRRAAAKAEFQKHLDAFKSLENVFDPASTTLQQQVTFLNGNFAARTADAAAEAEKKVQKFADDCYAQVDAVFKKTELFD